MATYEKQKTDGFHKITGLLVEIDQANMPFTNPVPVVGKGIDEAWAFLKTSPNGLLATITIKGKYDPSLTPSIGCRTTKKVIDVKNGETTSKEGVIVGLHLNPGPNVDPRIKSIAEQLKK